MTRGSVKEYAEAIRERYQRASRREKVRILDEFTQVTGYHRKAVIRLLGRERIRLRGRRRGRPRQYGEEVTAALKVVWEATDRLCSKRLQPFLPELAGILQERGELKVTPEMSKQMCQLSASTIDRLLRPYKRLGRRRPFSTTKPGSLLKAAIPIRTFADWDERRPGFLEVDLVAHCGESTEGFYLTTLSAVDVATGWVECRGVWGKGQQRVGSAVHHISQRLPFPLLGLDSDNGSEFINQHLYAYCQRKQITFTRSRPYKKNDSAHVEQKNWSVVRRVVGYDRYATRDALEQLNRLYHYLRLHINFFQPVMKLQHKTRHGAKVHKVYDTARTPYQRLLESGVLSTQQRDELAKLCHTLNPVQLLAHINQALEQLWTLAARPGQKEASVTHLSEATSALR
ncbi:MAG: transposase family protein [Dehalococcoidia bacterium]